MGFFHKLLHRLCHQSKPSPDWKEMAYLIVLQKPLESMLEIARHLQVLR
jgi:hypothetical protein